MRSDLIVRARFAAPLALALVLGVASPVAAEEIEVNVTTLLAGRAEPRLALGQVRTVVPAYQLLRLRAELVPLPGFDELRLVVAGWSEVAFNNDTRSDGDLELAYVEGKLVKRRVSVRVGRQLVAPGAGVPQMLDGAWVQVQPVAGLRVEAWAGAPVVPRFATRLADAVVGVRLAYAHGIDREVGFAFVEVWQAGYVARQDLAVDATWRAHRTLALAGYARLSLVELRLIEANLSADWQPLRELELRAGWRRTAPDLFIDRTSIFSVFSDETRDEIGGWLHARPLGRHLRLDADYHVDLHDGVAHRAGTRATVTIGPVRRPTRIGGELRLLARDQGGYQQARLFASHSITPSLMVTLDFDSVHLDRAINGQTLTLVATSSVAWSFASAWRLVLAGVIDSGPHVSQRLEVMARLEWRATIRVHEVSK